MMLPIIEKCTAHSPEYDLRGFRGELKSLELSRRLSSDVNDDDIGPVPDGVAGLFHAAAEVHFFVVEEESRVKSSSFRKSRGTDNGEGSGDPVDRCGFVDVCPGAVEVAEEL